MWKDILRILVITTSVLMYLGLEYSCFSELGWQSGQMVRLLFSVFAVMSIAGIVCCSSYVELEQIFDEEENCKSEQ